MMIRSENSFARLSADSISLARFASITSGTDPAQPESSPRDRHTGGHLTVALRS
jgi:hypothetical protein